ncbi:MAG: helix-turn-helix domain-containing protein [Oligoflexia bacterium]|nr:helix-turn-helix domain-containing protein [Oligoflexia bacterium]
MKQRNKFKNKDQFQLNFQAGSDSFQKKEEKFNSITQLIGFDKAGLNEKALSSGAFKLKAMQKSESKDLSKKSSESKLKESACASKQVQTVFFDNLITVEELAVVFRLAPQTIRNWVAQGKLPYVKIGKRNMFLIGSLQRWLNRKEKSLWQ